MPKETTTGERLLEYEEQLRALIERASSLTDTMRESLETVPNIEQHLAKTTSFVDRHRADAQAQIDQHRVDAQTQIDQHRADAQTQIDQYRADAQAQISQHRSDTQAQISQRVADVQAQIDQHLTDAQSHAQDAESHANDARSYKQTANAEVQEIERIKSASQGFEEAIEGTASDATTYHSAIEEMHGEISEKRAELASLVEEADTLTDKVENLLPGATSAGLASAFRERRIFVGRPTSYWFAILVASLSGLLLFAVLDLPDIKLVEPTLASLSGYLVSRLPFALPFVWLALYSGKRHSQALRLEEEYAHKEVLSKSFEGYKKQIAELEDGTGGNDQTLHLIRKTIEALALRPGRIYQGKRDERHPIWSLIRPAGRTGRDEAS
ncbi:MAG: hypothetical protein OXI35_18700 [Gemmatimonadota bacterium]|nr:hypothetical protein [Gemmatimonadota bacterium]